MSDEAKLCDSGVHACEAPIDCLKYYCPAQSIYREVKIAGDTGERKSGDTKSCGTDIRVGARLDIVGLVKAQIEYVREHATNENNAENGKPATAGDSGAATSRGKTSVGKNGVALARGNGVMVRGGIGAILVAAEEKDDKCEIQTWCAAVVDGKTIKADTWYKIENGTFVEVENEE